METAAAKSRFGVEPLARDTLQERVYHQVAGLILDGGIAPGELVTIQGLAKAFGVSSMPVREALKQLTAANALTVVSGRSIGIPPLSLDRLVDLRNVRVEMEGTAAAWAARAADPQAISAIDDQLTRMEHSTVTGDAKSYLQANRAFHFAVYQASQSATLLGLIEILWLQISPYFNLLQAPNHITSNVHHRSLVDALRARDEDAARAAIVSDIDSAFEILSTTLS